MITLTHVVPPRPGPDDAFFWDGLAAGELRLRRCAACGRVAQPPGPMCPGCGGTEHEVFTAEPRGRLLSWIRSRHPAPALPGQEIIALVELHCGARLVTNLQEVAEPVADMPVELFVQVLGGVTLPQARPAAANT